MSNGSNYEFKNLPLIPEAIRKLILDLFTGQIPARRKDIVKEVQQSHTERGGGAITADVTSGVKKVLGKLADEHRARKCGGGFWEILPLNGECAITPGNFSKEDNLKIEECVKQLAAVDVYWKKVIGSDEAENSLYLYYFPGYRKMADFKDEEFWPCKIGISGKDPTKRVLNEQATAQAEIPVGALLVWTPKAKALEKAIHKILEYRGRSKKEGKNPAGGSEWFITSPEEVLEIITFIDPNLCQKQ